MKLLDIHTHELRENSIYNWTPGDPKPAGMFSVGVHPWHLEESSWEEVKSYSSEATLIGETGLDYAREIDRELQKSFFRKHIQLARDLKKPLVLHCVRAYSDCLSELREFPHAVIFHDYNGGAEETKQILKRSNMFFSLGATLFREQSKVLSHLKELPLEKIFLETDDSKRSIAAVYEQYSKLSGVGVDIIAQQSLNNLNNLNKF